VTNCRYSTAYFLNSSEVFAPLFRTRVPSQWLRLFTLSTIQARIRPGSGQPRGSRHPDLQTAEAALKGGGFKPVVVAKGPEGPLWNLDTHSHPYTKAHDFNDLGNRFKLVQIQNGGAVRALPHARGWHETLLPEAPEAAPPGVSGRPIGGGFHPSGRPG